MSNPGRQLPGSRLTGDPTIETLVREHYASVYRLALATLQEVEAARQATVQTFVAALLDFHQHRPQDNVRLWLYPLALKAIRAEERRSLRKHVSPTSPVTPEARLWQWVDHLGPKERLLCVLYYVLGFEISEAAALLYVSQSAVRAQLEIFRGRFRQIPGSTPLSREQTGETLGALETRVAESLQKRWLAPQLSPAELEKVINQIKQKAAEELARRRLSAPYKWLALAGGIVILAVLCLGSVALAWFSKSKQAGESSQVTTYDQEVASTKPVKAPPLTKRSNSETFWLRMKESALLWKTLWIDVQIIDYGPQSYIGLPRAYRAQAWIRQPDQSLELFGLLSEDPNSVYMVEEGRSYYINPVLEMAYTEEWDGNTEELLLCTALRGLVFPGSGVSISDYTEDGAGIMRRNKASWAQREGSFKALRYERVAGRRAVVVDWIGLQDKRVARLWIDVQTGILLRLQEFGGDDFQTLISESTVTEIAYNQPSPPPRLSEALRLREPDTMLKWEQSSAARLSTLSPESLTTSPTLVAPLAMRSPIFPEPVPDTFDPTHSRLLFQFPQDAEIMHAITNTAQIPSGLIADGYLLGVIEFGLPWVLRCDRSPDGQRLAFNTWTDGIAPADDTLRWFNLKEPQAIYQPLPGLHAASFTFSPDSRQLVVFGTGEGQWESGIYLLEIGTGEYELLMNLAKASSLVWSPDGEYLALIGSIREEDETAALIIHVNTAQVAYHIETEFLHELVQEDESYSDWPMAAWGVEFPMEMGGMDECAEPP